MPGASRPPTGIYGREALNARAGCHTCQCARKPAGVTWRESEVIFAIVIMSDKPRHFAVCIQNDEQQESLELRKIYEVLEDPDAGKHKMLRVIDEEGEDYLYPENWFLPIELSQEIEQAVVELTR